MIHHDMVVDQAVRLLADMIHGQETEVYLVQNIYGKLMVYLDTQKPTLLDSVSEKLSAALGPWFQGCDLYSTNLFVKSEIELRKKTARQIQDHIWLLEKFLTNLYWADQPEKRARPDINRKLVSFYSFKGGVSRTTTMIMAAIALARRGKRVLLIDFDLEAPGIAGLFPQENLPKYGLLDFLVEYNAFQAKEEQLSIDEYIYPVGEFCQATSAGGDIYVMPAYGSVLKAHPELYRKALMRLDLDLPTYTGDQTPIDSLLSKLTEFSTPDVIFIDTRSGIHQIGGITLTRYSDLALLFFYGSQQNIDGMKMVLPHMKESKIPFLLVNAKVPYNQEVAKIEEDFFIEGAYEALCTCDPEYRDGKVLMEDTDAEHFPLKISYNPSAEVLQNTDQLLKAFEEQRGEYQSLADTIWDAVSPSEAEASNADMPAGIQESIIRAFSRIMGGLETAAAEDEFSTTDDLRDNFYPLQAFSFIFDPRKFLVLGQKGVGKTALFSALKDKEYAVSLARYVGANTRQYERMEWLVGTSDTTPRYHDAAPLLAKNQAIRAFWHYAIIQTLCESDPSLIDLLPGPVKTFIEEPFEKIILNLNTENAFQLHISLEEIDKRYRAAGKNITIIYDALDCIVGPEMRGEFLSALIDIWYKNMNTLTSIRCKIFLREDIFTREINVADKIKLQNYSSTIKWQYDQLFALVWKRALSKDTSVGDWYAKIVGHAPQAVSEQDPSYQLGYIPEMDAQTNKALLAALIGTKMGSGKKASTYNWFRNRLADTNGVIVPRSMIDIFSKAASAELELRKRGPITSKSIIRPPRFEENLKIVSEKRVVDLKEEYVEYRTFFDSLKDTIQRSPVSEDLLQKALEHSGQKNPAEEITNLVKIGVIKRYQRRSGDPVRYHFPDIYLHGLGLQRSGMR